MPGCPACPPHATRAPGGLTVLPRPRACSGARWRSLDEEAQLGQLMELQRHYENIKDEAVALFDGSVVKFATWFEAAPLFRGGSDGAPAGPTQAPPSEPTELQV